ncbi:signal recognition particle-docking protein FtsY [Candidatus Woesearchaeota archaeon]|nr:signal recognition particle-docking protein FtsY [Candidatus Woesearchaeota archaeon]
MFNGLRDKLKGVLKKFSKQVEDEAVEEVQEEVPAESPRRTKPARAPAKAEEQEAERPAEEPALKEEQEPPAKELAAEEKDEVAAEEPPEAPEEKQRSFISKLFKKKEAAEAPGPEVIRRAEEPSARESAGPAETAPKAEKDIEGGARKEGFFKKLTKITLSEERFESLFWDIEVTLLENNVAVEVIERIKEDLKSALTGEKMSRKSVEDTIKDTLRGSIKDILSVEPVDLLKEAERKKPLVIAMIGVNGSGKTTTLAKLAKYFQDHGKSVVVAAADTFRAAAIQQLEEHTTKLGVKLIKHDYGGDPAAVAYDAVKHADAKGIDIVLIDSAGRLHSNDNLMNELKKLVRINKPDLNLFVGEAITGNDCVEQAKLFDEAVGIDGIILAKADVDEKGGAAISASYVTKKPVLFLGTGQGYDDLAPFRPEAVLESLGL